MSIINTMLKDLDKRKQPHALENMNVIPVQYQAMPSSKLPWVLLALVCLVFICAVAYEWDMLTQNINNSSQQIESIESNTLAPTQSIAKKSQELTSPNELKEEVSKPHSQLSTLSEIRDEEDIKYESSARVIKSPLSMSQSSAPAAIEKEKIENPLPAPTTKKMASEIEDTLVVNASEPANKPKVNSSSMAITEVRLSNTQLAKKRFKLGTQAEERGEQRDAIEYYREALLFSPQLHKAREHLAALYYGQGNLDQASTILKQGIALYPQKFDYLILLARVQQAAGEYIQALQNLSRIPDGDILSRQKWIQESSIGQKVRNYTLAEASYRKLLQTETTQSRWWMGLAYALDAQKKYEIAIEAYRQALFYRAVPKQGLSVQAVDYIETRLVQLGESL